MKQWLKDMGALLSKAWFSVPVALTAIVGYGYGLTHEALHVDDLAIGKYVQEGVSLSQGRLGSWLLSKLFGFASYRGGTMQFFGLLFFALAATALCVLLKRQSENRLRAPVYPLFACFLISYPMISAAWVYDSLAFCLGAGYWMTALSLTLASAWVRAPRGGYGYAVGSLLLLLFTLLTYETFASVYICGVFLCLLLRWLYGAPEERKLSVILVNGLKYASVLAIAVTLRVTLFPVFGAMRLEWRTLFRTLFVYFALAAKWYLPIRILLAAAVALAVGGLLCGIRRKKTIWLLVLGMLFSLFALPLVTRSYNGYRAFQVASLFVASTALLLAQAVFTKVNCRRARVAIVSLLGLICLWQTLDLDNWLHLDVQRYREEVQVITDVYRTVETEVGFDKPVEFIGLYQLSDAVMEQCAVTKADPACRLAFKLLRTDAAWFRYADSTVFSYLQDGLEAFYPGEMLEALLRFNGMQFMHVGTEEMYARANVLGADMPCWPERGSIAETEDFTIVKLGEIWIPPDQG